jgi:hypothetical protein
MLICMKVVRGAAFVGVAVCTAAAALADSPPIPDPVAFVVELEGRWNVEGSPEPLAAGQQLPAGTRILGNLDSNARIVIARLDGSAPIVRVCATVGACAGTIEVGTSPGGSSSWQERALDAARQLLFPEPRPPVRALARGAVGRDAVLELENGQVEWIGTFVGLDPASTRPVFRRVGADGAIAGEITPPLAPGVYQVTLADDADAEAWILAAPSPAYAIARRDFDRFTKLTEGWSGAGPDETQAVRDAATQLRRAYLLHLAQSE